MSAGLTAEVARHASRFARLLVCPAPPAQPHPFEFLRKGGHADAELLGRFCSGHASVTQALTSSIRTLSPMVRIGGFQELAQGAGERPHAQDAPSGRGLSCGRPAPATVLHSTHRPQQHTPAPQHRPHSQAMYCQHKVSRTTQGVPQLGSCTAQQAKQVRLVSPSVGRPRV